MRKTVKQEPTIAQLLEPGNEALLAKYSPQIAEHCFTCEWNTVCKPGDWETCEMLNEEEYDDDYSEFEDYE